MADPRFEGLSDEERTQLEDFYGPDFMGPVPTGNQSQLPEAAAAAPKRASAAPESFESRLARQETTAAPQAKSGLAAAAAKFAPQQFSYGPPGPNGQLYKDPTTGTLYTDYERLQMAGGQAPKRLALSPEAQAAEASNLKRANDLAGTTTAVPGIASRYHAMDQSEPVVGFSDAAGKGLAGASTVAAADARVGGGGPGVDLRDRARQALLDRQAAQAMLDKKYNPSAVQTVRPPQNLIFNDAAYDARTPEEKAARAALPWYHPKSLTDWIMNNRNAERDRGIDVAQSGIGKSAAQRGAPVTSMAAAAPSTPEQIAAAEAKQEAVARAAQAEEDAKVMRFAKYIGESDPGAAADLLRMLRARQEREADRRGGTAAEAAAALQKAGY